MEPLRLQAVAARVVAWHNQHALSRPITAAHVYSIGYVALPFRSAVAPDAGTDPVGAPAEEAGSLRERAMARSRQGEPAVATPPAPAQPAADHLQGAFTERLLPGFRPSRVARFAARHGRTMAEVPAAAPLREVAEDGSATAPHPVTLYVLTAAIEVGKRRTRVLVGAGGTEAAVLGRPLLDVPRLVGLTVVGLLVMAVAGAGFALWQGGLFASDGVSTPAESVAAAASAASAPGRVGLAASVAAHGEAAASAPRIETAVAVATEGVHLPGASSPHPQPSAPGDADPHSAHAGAAPVAAPEVHGAPPEPAPVEVEPHTAPPSPPGTAAGARNPLLAAAPMPQTLQAPPGRIVLPTLAQLIPESAKAEARAARRAREGGASAPDGSNGAPAAVPAAAAPPHDPIWALSTRPLRTRTEAEQVMAAMDGLLRPLGRTEVRTEVLPQGDDWRVVGWPYTDRREAERALAVLAARGMRVQVIGF